MASGAGQAAAAVPGDAIDVISHRRAHQAFESGDLDFMLATVVQYKYCLGHRIVPRIARRRTPDVGPGRTGAGPRW
jgi:hypothetical protein